MGVLTETEVYETSIRQLEITDPVLGGIDGPVNVPTRQLANRTKYLKGQQDALKNEIGTARGSFDSLDARMDAIESETLQGDTTFNGTSGRTISHSIGNINYIVNVSPTEATGGDLGDVYISKAANAFTIYNTGGFIGVCRYQILA